MTQANTRGSVVNALMIDSGEARYALVQSDVAAAAVTGQAAFATYGPLRHLRAVAALFPEPVHVVDPHGRLDPVDRDLRGKRIAVGSRGSGTRQTAMQVLRAHGLDHGDYVIVDARDPEEALQLLAAGRIDAVIEVVSAPWRQLASSGGTGADDSGAARCGRHGHVCRSRCPAWYRSPSPIAPTLGSRAPSSTLAATALLVASDSVPDASVKQVLDFLFTSGLAADRGVSASRLSRERALAGVTIPLHDGAADYFAATRSSAADAAPAPATPAVTP